MNNRNIKFHCIYINVEILCNKTFLNTNILFMCEKNVLQTTKNTKLTHFFTLISLQNPRDWESLKSDKNVGSGLFL